MVEPETYEFTRIIKRLYSLLAQNIDLLLRPYGLARTQYIVLYNSQVEGGVPTKVLLEKLQVEGATLSGIVDTLAVKGLVRRLEQPDDKRRKRVELTAAGRRLLRKIPVPAAAIEKTVLADIDVIDVAIFKTVSERLIRNLESLKTANEKTKGTVHAAKA